MSSSNFMLLPDPHPIAENEIRKFLCLKKREKDKGSKGKKGGLVLLLLVVRFYVGNVGMKCVKRKERKAK